MKELRMFKAVKFIVTMGLMVWPSLGVSAATATHPFPLRDVRLLEGPFLQAQQADLKYMLALDPNRLLAPFRKEAGLPAKAKPYGNWESEGLGGHIGGHYLTALSQMAVITNNPEIKRRLDYMLSELAACQKANDNGYIGGVPHSKALWRDIAAGKIHADSFSLDGRWVPLYNIHKVWAGLRDAYLIAGKQQARDMLIKMTDWWTGVVKNLSDQQIQEMLRSEQGGINEVIADVYAITGDKKYLALAQRCNHRQLLVPLEQGRDILTGLHANTQISQVVGFERIAQLGGDPNCHRAAEFFWQNVTQKRSIAIGGNSVREHFNPVNDFTSMVQTRQGPETCNTYNMLRLTEKLFYTKPEARYADFYERALFNHILSTENPKVPGFVYFTPIRPEHYRVYSQPQKDFWCCVGTGMENHGKYGEFIYSQGLDKLYVNLFMASVLTWPEKHLSLRQTTHFPDEAATHLTLTLAQPLELTVSIRYPHWVAPGELKLHLNGQAMPVTNAPGSYIHLHRTWHDQDRLDLDLPMHTHVDPLPDHCGYVAIMHGPIVLAAATGQKDQVGLRADGGRWAHIPRGPLVPLNQAPMLVAKDAQDVVDVVKPVPGQPMTFTAASVIQPAQYQSLRLVPFYRLYDTRYMLYWNLTTPADYQQVVVQLKAEEQARLALDTRTLDKVVCGEQQPEMDHGYHSEQSNVGDTENRHWRESRAWFSYELRGDLSKSLVLQVTTVRGGRGRIAYEIFVNDKTIATVQPQRAQGKTFVTDTYPLDPAILKSDQGPITIKFQALDNARTARVCEVRLLRKE